MSDRHQPFSARHPNRLDQHRIHQREDHRVEADPHRQRRHHGGGKPPMGQNHTHREPQIVSHEIELRETIPACSREIRVKNLRWLPITHK